MLTSVSFLFTAEIVTRPSSRTHVDNTLSSESGRSISIPPSPICSLSTTPESTTTTTIHKTKGRVSTPHPNKLPLKISLSENGALSVPPSETRFVKEKSCGHKPFTLDPIKECSQILDNLSITETESLDSTIYVARECSALNKKSNTDDISLDYMPVVCKMGNAMLQMTAAASPNVIYRQTASVRPKSRVHSFPAPPVRDDAGVRVSASSKNTGGLQQLKLFLLKFFPHISRRVIKTFLLV